MRDLLVDIGNLRFRHAGAAAPLFEDLSLRIYTGERVLITGPSGFGKSTLLCIIAGLIPDPIPGVIEGRVTCVRDDAAMVFQNPESQMVAPSMEEELAFGLENRATPPSEMHARVEDSLRRLSFHDGDRSPMALSGGERQRLALESALVMKPKLLLLDEPTSYLDPMASGELMDRLKAVGPETTIVMVEHKVDCAFPLADRIVSFGEDGSIADRARPAASALGRFLPWSLAALMKRGSRTAVGVDHEHRADGGRGHTETAIEVRDACFSYASPVLENVSFSVGSGETLVVMGPNGAGKSTLLQCLCGLKRLASGSVMLFGRDAGRLRPRERFRAIMYLPQNPEHFFLRESVAAELALAAGIGFEEPAGIAKEPSIHRAADRFRLRGLLDRNPFSLSEGEKRRLTLACAFLDERALIVLDEPTYGLDYSAFAELVESIRALAERGRAMVIVTHSPELAHLVGDRIIMLDRGRVTYDGTPADVPGDSPLQKPVWARLA